MSSRTVGSRVTLRVAGSGLSGGGRLVIEQRLAANYGDWSSIRATSVRRGARSATVDVVVTEAGSNDYRAVLERTSGAVARSGTARVSGLASVRIGVPKDVPVWHQTRVTATVRYAGYGQEIVLERRIGERWVVVPKARSAVASNYPWDTYTVSFPVVLNVIGTHDLRLRVVRQGSFPTAVSAPVTVRIRENPRYGDLEVVAKGVPDDDEGSGVSFIGAGTALSADGRYVAFVTPRSLVPQDQNDSFDVYWRDTGTGRVQLVSALAPSGAGSGPGLSTDPDISTDGRYVAFGYAPSPDVGVPREIYRWDSTTGELRRVGVEGRDLITPQLAGAGRWIAYLDIPRGLSYLWDSETGTAELVAPAADDGVYDATVSEDGRWLAFASDGGTKMHLWDRETDTITDLPRPGYSPRISADGSSVVFVGPVHLEGRTWQANVLLWDRASGTTTLVSHDADGAPSQARDYEIETTEVDLSADGSRVFFISNTSNLGHTTADRQGYLWSREDDTVRHVPQYLYPTGATWHSQFISISGDGRSLSFDGQPTETALETVHPKTIFVSRVR